MNVYGDYALHHPHSLKFVACADPNLGKRTEFARKHGIPPERSFSTDDEILTAGKLADAAFICTMDQFHEKEVMRALDLGYHVLLEKPMTTTESGCRKIVTRSVQVGKVLSVGHVLRYSPLFAKVKELVDSGVIGKVINIRHSENMATWVYAHSFVRGNWENSKRTSSLLVQKGVHDFDLIYWFANSPPISVSCVTMPSVLRSEFAPAGVPLRCTDGCPYATKCVYEATQFYLQGKFILQDNLNSEKPWIRWIFRLALKYPRFASTIFPPLRKFQVVPWRRWPTTQLSDNLSDASIFKALQEGPFGRCVYHCDNDQPVSHTVNIQFQNGITATYTLHGMSYRDGRETRIDGTLGTIKAYFYNTAFYVDLFIHNGAIHRRYNLPIEMSAGGGGDIRIVDNFLEALVGRKSPLTPPQESLYSHLIAFAAERSVEKGRVEKIQ